MEREQIPKKLPHPAVSFLKEASAEGAIERYKTQRTNTKAARNLNMVGLYWGTYLEQADIADLYGMTNQGVSYTISRTMKNIWRRSSVITRSRYPLQTITTQMPFWDKIDQFAKTEKAQQVISLQNNGFPQAEISEQTGVKKMFVSRLFLLEEHRRQKKVRERGQEISMAKEMIKQVIRESDDVAMVQAAFDLLTLGMASNLIKDHPEEFVSMARLFKTSPTRKFPEIVNHLLKNALPVLRIDRGKSKKGYSTTNYYVRAKDQEKITDFLENNTSFRPRENKVGVFSGVVEELPKTTDLEKNYIGALSGIGRHANHQALKKRGLTIVDLLTGCPVTLIEYRNGFFVTKEDSKKMQRFLRRRLNEVGIPIRSKS